MPRPDNVGVGIAIAVVNSNAEVLCLKRKGAHQAGTWAFPGGWIEADDASLFDTCARELREEVGLNNYSASDLLEVTTEYHDDLECRTVTVYFLLWYDPEIDGIPEIMEPDKCEELRWVPITPDGMPTPAFPQLDQAWEKLCNMKKLLTDIVGTGDNE